MGFYKKCITIIVITFLMSGICSCGSSKKVIEKTKTVFVHDTITEFKNRIITKSIIDTLLIESPCDSLGNLKPFKQIINTGTAKIVIENIKGKIQATVNIDSIVNSRLEIYKSNHKSNTVIEKTKIVKYRLGKIGWISILMNIVFFILIGLILRKRLKFF